MSAVTSKQRNAMSLCAVDSSSPLGFRLVSVPVYLLCVCGCVFLLGFVTSLFCCGRAVSGVCDGSHVLLVVRLRRDRGST